MKKLFILILIPSLCYTQNEFNLSDYVSKTDFETFLSLVDRSEIYEYSKKNRLEVKSITLKEKPSTYSVKLNDYTYQKDAIRVIVCKDRNQYNYEKYLSLFDGDFTVTEADYESFLYRLDRNEIERFASSKMAMVTSISLISSPSTYAVKYYNTLNGKVIESTYTCNNRSGYTFESFKKNTLKSRVNDLKEKINQKQNSEINEFRNSINNNKALMVKIPDYRNSILENWGDVLNTITSLFGGSHMVGEFEIANIEGKISQIEGKSKFKKNREFFSNREKIKGIENIGELTIYSDKYNLEIMTLKLNVEKTNDDYGEGYHGSHGLKFYLDDLFINIFSDSDEYYFRLDDSEKYKKWLISKISEIKYPSIATSPSKYIMSNETYLERIRNTYLKKEKSRIHFDKNSLIEDLNYYYKKEFFESVKGWFDNLLINWFEKNSELSTYFNLSFEVLNETNGNINVKFETVFGSFILPIENYKINYGFEKFDVDFNAPVELEVSQSLWRVIKTRFSLYSAKNFISDKNYREFQAGPSITEKIDMVEISKNYLFNTTYNSLKESNLNIIEELHRDYATPGYKIPKKWVKYTQSNPGYLNSIFEYISNYYTSNIPKLDDETVIFNSVDIIQIGETPYKKSISLYILLNNSSLANRCPFGCEELWVVDFEKDGSLLSILKNPSDSRLGTRPRALRNYNSYYPESMLRVSKEDLIEVTKNYNNAK